MSDTSKDMFYKQQYEAALRHVGITDAPEWYDLDEQTKERIRNVNNENQRMMNRLGKAIANNESLDEFTFTDDTVLKDTTFISDENVDK